MGSFMICISHQTLSSYQIEKNEMGEACSTMGERNGLYSVLVEKREGKVTIWKTQA